MALMKASTPKKTLAQKMARHDQPKTSSLADERTEGQPEARDRGPMPEGPGPLGPVGIEVSDHRQGARL